MSVDRDEVRRIAELAKLDLDDAEADRLTGEMNRILEHAERLRGLDADGGSGVAAGGAYEGREVSSDGREEPSPGRSAFSAGADGSSTAQGASSGGPGDTGSGSAGGVAGASEPDPLLRPPGAFAPEMIEGFFVVPPPPGVVADPPDGREGEGGTG